MRTRGMKFERRAFRFRSGDVGFGQMSVSALSVRVNGRLVLDSISLDVRQGEIVGLLGRDGAGKTVCFEALAGVTRASGGEVLLNGVDISAWPIEQRAKLGLAYLPEEISIFRGLTVQENISMALENSTADPGGRDARLQVLLADFDLNVVRNQLATTISGGERRRCEVARAMALDPAILLLDEPFRGLDPTSIANTKRVIGGLKARNVGVLVSDYNLHDLLELTDRVYVLHRGQIVFTGKADQLLSDPGMREIFLGDSFSL